MRTMAKDWVAHAVFALTFALAGCATANNDDYPSQAKGTDSGSAGAADARGDGAKGVDVDPGGTGGGDSGVDTGRVDPAIDAAVTVETESGVAETGAVVDTAPPDGAPSDGGATDTDFVVPDVGPVLDAGCPPPPVLGPSEGASCASPIAVSLDVTCKQSFTGDSCLSTSHSTSCGAGQGLIYNISISSGIRLYSIAVSPGFTLATIPGPPICGGAGSCVGASMSTGVSSTSSQWWTVLKSGGGCGPYTLTITPS